MGHLRYVAFCLSGFFTEHVFEVFSAALFFVAYFSVVLILCA